MRVIYNRYNPSYIVLLSAITALLLFFLLKATTHAATINVVAGTDAIQENNQCQLSEAIENINDQAQTNDDCPAGDGNNDTIQLPAGIISFEQEVTTKIYEPVVIQGQGKGQTIIDGAGQWSGFRSAEPTDPTISGITIAQLTLRGVKGNGIDASIAVEELTVSGVEIDGTDSDYDAGGKTGINAAASNIRINDLYIHSFSGTGADNNIIAIALYAIQNRTIDVEINDLTISNLIGSNTRSVNGVTAITGIGDGSFAPGTINLTLNNATISNITNSGGNAGYIGAISAVNNGLATVNTTIKNSTLRVAGAFPDANLSGALFMTGIALGAEDNATVNYQVQIP